MNVKRFVSISEALFINYCSVTASTNEFSIANCLRFTEAMFVDGFTDYADIDEFIILFISQEADITPLYLKEDRSSIQPRAKCILLLVAEVFSAAWTRSNIACVIFQNPFEQALLVEEMTTIHDNHFLKVICVGLHAEKAIVFTVLVFG